MVAESLWSGVEQVPVIYLLLQVLAFGAFARGRSMKASHACDDIVMFFYQFVQRG
jgi:hypothetical protein